MLSLPHSVPQTLWQATTNSHLCLRLLDTHRRVWVSLLWGHCSFLLGSGACRILFVPPKSLFPQFCVSSGGSVLGLMATSSKRAYAIPRSAAPRAPTPVTGHCWHSNTQKAGLRAQSLWGLLVCARFCLSWASLVGMGFDTKRDFAPPPPPFCWGFYFALGCGVSFFGGIQHSSVDGCSAASCNSGVLIGKDEHTSFYSVIL